MVTPALPWLLLLLAGGAPEPGRVQEKIVSASDPTQSYAVYLPSGYTADRRWPLVILMDPRGRALVPLERFQAAAERRGYILMSSYNTLSDGPREPNARAVNAMLPDARQLFSLDRARLYLAGFSGTARVAWEFAHRLRPPAAGIIGAGAGLPGGLDPPREPKVAFFGTAGNLDFNYEEMLQLEEKLEELGLPHRFVDFEGEHSWPPADIAALALDWIELQAMKSGLRPAEGTLIGEINAALAGHAKSLEAAGRWYEASLAWKGLAADLAGLSQADAAAAAARAGELERTKEVRQARSRVGKMIARRRDYEGKLAIFLAKLARAAPTPALEESLETLQIAALRKQAEGSGAGEDPLGALASRRLLELVFVQTSFYEPRAFLEKKDPARALAVLRIAAAIKPSSPQLCFNLARARAQAGQKKEALEALECLAAAGIADHAFLEQDAWLAPLRDDPGFKALMEKLRAGTR